MRLPYEQTLATEHATITVRRAAEDEPTILDASGTGVELSPDDVRGLSKMLMETIDVPLERLFGATDRDISAVVAWSALPKRADEAEGLECWCPGVWYDAGQWMLASGLLHGEATAMAVKVRTLGYIDGAGTAWGPVLTLARARVSKRLAASPGKKKR